MWAYWLMLLVPMLGAVSRRRLPRDQARWIWFLSAVFFTTIIGLRHEVGGDWFTYGRHFEVVARMPLPEVMSAGWDVGYYGLNWVVAHFGGDVYFLNFLCAVPLVWGTIALCRQQAWPWLGLYAAVPYLLIVVGMGYTRQSAAIGFVMLGLVCLADGKVRQFVGWTLVAATFHKTATLIIPLAALSADRNRIWTAFWVLVMAILGTWLFLAERSERLWANYVESAYADASSGAAIRVAMNLIPAILFLALRKSLTNDRTERRMWTWMSILSILCVPMLLVSATATDRMALYFIPLQIVVAARLCRLAHTVKTRSAIFLCILFFYAMVQFVWLNFAHHSFAWIPYQFLPLW